jgi:hypothetical protein
MECEYPCLNHNLLVSQKKSDHQGPDYKGALLYFFFTAPVSEITKISSNYVH